ncbi:MAG TPA: DUF2520 domain-containing protein [Terriglobales bacterium]|nr:DUF2520 domain-containing protein [Terriglobales bacterium]
MSLKNPKVSITLIGSGNLAQALGPALRKAGYVIDAVIARSNMESRKRAGRLARKVGARVQAIEEFEPKSHLIWLLHTDDALGETAKALAKSGKWKGKSVFHSSGALTSDVLEPLKRAGAYSASLHPMMTFVPGSTPEMSGIPFAVEGDKAAVAVAKQIARDVGGEVFEIRKENKVLYHALGSFSSPMLVATLVTAERVGRGAGLNPVQTRKVMRPILEQTLRNYFAGGAAAAFSGPIKRGDLETIRRHLRELARIPEAGDVYRALVKSGLMELPSARKRKVLKMLTTKGTKERSSL